MKSASDCFQHAARCEQMAEASSDRNNKTVLLGLATQWRELGNEANVWDSARKSKSFHTKMTEAK
jgi:hypothetical protein